MTSEYLIGNLKLGDATNHVSITSLVTGIKSVQFPDFGGTIALIEKAQTWSLTQTFSEQLLGKNGTKTSPSYSFNSDSDTGFFWKSSGSVGFSANDTEIGSWSSAGAFTFGTTTGSYYHVLQSIGALSDGVNVQLVIKDYTTGYSAGNGGGISLWGSYNSSNSVTVGGSIKLSKSNSTDGDYGFNLDFYTRKNTTSQQKAGFIDSTGFWNLGVNSACNAKIGQTNPWTTHSWQRSIEIPNAAILKWVLNTSYAWGVGATSGEFRILSSTADDNSVAPNYVASCTGLGSWSFGPINYTGTHTIYGLTTHTGYGKFGNTACSDGGQPTYISGVERTAINNGAYDTKILTNGSLLMIRENTTSGNVGLFFMTGGTATLLVASSTFSVIDEADRACLLYDTGTNGGSGSGFTLKNNLGSPKKFSYHLISLGGALA